jgi:hypothetical protein
LIAGSSVPLFSPGELLALVLKPRITEEDSLFAELLNAGELGSACVATVIQVMQPQHCNKYRASLVRVQLYIHYCCTCDGSSRSGISGTLLLWDRQLGIAALFDEGDTLYLQFPVWVSSYDAEDITNWTSDSANAVLMEVGPQSALFVHAAEVQPVNLKITAAALQLQLKNAANEEPSVSWLRTLPMNLTSYASAKIAAQAARAPVAINAEITDTIVCPQIEALKSTYVYALPLPVLLCDVAAGMRGLCCMVQILSYQSVRLEGAGNSHAANCLDRIGVIVDGWGRGSDVSVFRKESCSTQVGDFGCQNLYKISDGWGCCNLLLPCAENCPSTLLHKTVLLHGFDCNKLEPHNCNALVCHSQIVLMPHSSYQVLPITLNIGLAMSAASHGGATAAVAASMVLGRSMVSVPQDDSKIPCWVPSHALSATLLSVCEGIGAANCSVVLQDTTGAAIRLPCSSSSHPQLLSSQLLPLVGAKVVCVLTVKREEGHVQIEGIYRC